MEDNFLNMLREKIAYFLLNLILLIALIISYFFIYLIVVFIDSRFHCDIPIK